MVGAKRQHERGATAIIVVVFSVLLLVTITVGFMRLVVQDQIRSSNNELSRGAYDSALAGVEDGKRVLEACKQTPGGDACTAIDNQKCTTITDAGFASMTDNEVKLRTTAGVDGGFDQAYTCLTITPDTSDYKGDLTADSSRIIPLKTTGSFNTVTVSWFKSTGVSKPINLVSNKNLPLFASWSPANSVTPPLMRAQLIMYRDDGYKVADFDTSGGGNTLYLFPASSGSASASFALDARPDATGASLVQVACNKLNPYVCSVNLQLPHAVDPAAASNRYVAYLRLTALYGDADFSVAPQGTTFDGVQPVVDSTGRASNVFRRISARVEQTNPNDAQLFPRATVDITNNFCKSFGITDTQHLSFSCDYTAP